MLRRRLSGTPLLLCAVLALPGVARAQATPAPPPKTPAPARPGLDGVVVPLVADAPVGEGQNAPRVIASSEPGPPPLSAVPVPDDGLSPSARRPATPAASSPRPAVRTAVYRQDIDAGPVQLVDSAPGRAGTHTAVPIAVGARLDLLVEAPSAIVPGKAFSYVIRVASTGSKPATAVRITDRLPAAARLIGAEPKPEIAGDRLTWDLGDLPPGVERLVKVALDAERLTAEFAVSPVASFGVASDQRVAAARPKLEVQLTGPESVAPGAVVPFKVHVVNNSTITMQRVRVLAKLTPGLRHPRMSRENAIEAEVALSPGETKTLPLDLLAGAPGQNDITVFARSDENVFSTVASIRVDQAAAIPAGMVARRAAPRLQVEINNLSASQNIGGVVLYEIKLQNPDDTSQTGIRVLADLSEGLEPDQGDGPTASVVTARGVVFETLRRLDPGESVVYHVRARPRRAGVQQLRVEVNADHLAQPATAETNTWIAPGRGH